MAGMISIDRTRTMITAVQDVPPVAKYFRSTFFPGSVTHVTEEIDFDYMKGVRPMAPFVAPAVGGIPMERQGYETKSFTMPRISPERVITNDIIAKRSMGEPIYSDRTPEQRAREMEAQDYLFLDEAIALREEWMCRQLLFEGKITAKGKTNTGSDVEFSVDYGFTNKEALGGADLWTASSSDPIEQLVQWRRDIVAACNISPDIILTDSATAMKLLNNEKFVKYYDVRRYDFGTMAPVPTTPLAMNFGRIPVVGADLVSYDATFIDPETGTVTPFIPANTILFASRAIPGSIHYGLITYMDNEGGRHSAALPRVPMVYFDPADSISTLRLQSRPVPMPVNVDSWAVRVVA